MHVFVEILKFLLIDTYAKINWMRIAEAINVSTNSNRTRDLRKCVGFRLNLNCSDLKSSKTLDRNSGAAIRE